MRKLLLLLALLSWATPELSFSSELYQFNTGTSTCLLKKFVDKKWTPTSKAEVQGESFLLTPTTSSTTATFRIRKTWYSTRVECVKKNEKKSSFFIEGKGAYSLMTGSGTAAQTTIQSGATTTIGKYTPKPSFGLRFGDYLSPDRALFFDFDYFSGGSNDQTQVGATTFTGTTSEKILNFDVGYQLFFPSTGSLTPYLAGGAGYSLLSGSIQFSGIPDLAKVTYSGSNLNLFLEGGATYHLAEHFSIVSALNYLILNISSFKVDTSTDTTGNFPVGAKLSNTVGYSRLGLKLGLQYIF